MFGFLQSSGINAIYVIYYLCYKFVLKHTLLTLPIEAGCLICPCKTRLQHGNFPLFLASVHNSLRFSAVPLVFSEWSSTTLLSIHSIASFQCENFSFWFWVVWWASGFVLVCFYFSAYHSTWLCYGFAFNLLWLFSFRELKEVLRYDRGYVIFLHVDLILQKSEFPGNPWENLILLATFLPLTTSFTGKVTHHLRFQQFHLGLF